MSVAAIDWAFEQKVGDWKQKFVLVVLSDGAGFDGLVRLNAASVSRITGLSEPDVLACVDGLVRSGFLARQTSEPLADYRLTGVDL